MKLYTEEDLKDAFYKGFYTKNEIECCVKAPADVFCRKYVKTLIPIVLPSDDEIEKESFYKSRGEDMELQYYSRHFFEEGAKWMKEQIINQNK